MKSQKCEGTTFNAFVETEVPQNELIISRTDLKGIITYVNDTFAEISGYSANELIGKAHNIVRHPDMPSSAFKDIWETISAKKTWKGYVKNLRKDGGYYWVYAEISGVYKNGEIIEYKSLREPVNKSKSQEMQIQYDQARHKEDNVIRLVAYVNNKTLYRLESFAEKEGCSLGEALDRLTLQN